MALASSYRYGATASFYAKTSKNINNPQIRNYAPNMIQKRK